MPLCFRWPSALCIKAGSHGRERTHQISGRRCLTQTREYTENTIFSEYRAHTLPLYSKYKLLKFSDIVQFKTLLIMRKAKEGSLPDNIQLFFKIKLSSNVNTRQEGKFYVVFARTKLKSKCISICGIKFWNKLNSNISGIKSFKKFLISLKEIHT